MLGQTKALASAFATGRRSSEAPAKGPTAASVMTPTASFSPAPSSVGPSASQGGSCPASDPHLSRALSTLALLVHVGEKTFSLDVDGSTSLEAVKQR